MPSKTSQLDALSVIWGAQKRARASIDKLKNECAARRTEAVRMWAKGDKQKRTNAAESVKLFADGDLLWSEGTTLMAKSAEVKAKCDSMWAAAVKRLLGNVTIEWTDYGCIVDNKHVFG